MTTSPSQSTPQTSSNLTLPEGLSPDSVDTLPVLSALLSRLQNTSDSTTSGSPPVTSPPQLENGTGPLAIKDIPAATDELKHRLQKARVQFKQLPDIERGLKEQEEEIKMWEGKIKRQREVLEGLRDVGLKSKKEREEAIGASKQDQAMEGIE